ncbi:MAG: hypothetical protein PHO37_03730 [Kiritimatiellae bacterium]|nr:hypothetical protein [Kiritimatiellia bacterium]
MIVNATPLLQKATVEFAEQGHSAKLHRSDKSVERSFDSLPQDLIVELEPFGVRMLIVR